MQELPKIFENLRQTAFDVFSTILNYLPDLLGAALLVLVGWFVAKFARRGMRRLGDLVNRGLDSFLTKGSLARFRLSVAAIALLANISFWLVIFIFFSAATKVAGLDAFSSWLDDIVSYLPTILAGIMIVLVGFLISTFVRDLTVSAAAAASFSQAELFGGMAQGTTLLIATVIGLDQIGIDVTFLVIILAVAFAAILAGFALAFGLGARDLTANLIAAHYLKEDVEPGQQVRIGKIEGIVIEITPTSFVLDTEAGRTVIPATLAQNSTVTILAGDDSDE
ncbi:MAG: hypothetical protein RIC36_00135 [Rhodospirillales bacterium]